MSEDGSWQTAVSYGGKLWVSSDSGDTWEYREANRLWKSVAISSDGSVQTAIVAGGRIYVSIDFGGTWTAKESDRDWQSVAMSSDGSWQTAVADGAQIYVSSDFGETWAERESALNWRSVAMSSDGSRQTAVVYGGQIHVSSGLYFDFPGTVHVNEMVGIGIADPAYDLHVNGSAGKPGGGTWTDSSDERLNENIRPLSGRVALDKLGKLRGVSYYWINPEEHSDSECVGVTAQNLEEVFPEWVDEIAPAGADALLIPEGEKAKTVRFPHDFNAYVIEAVKELDAENGRLKSENNTLEAENAELKIKMDRLEDSMRRLRQHMDNLEDRMDRQE